MPQGKVLLPQQGQNPPGSQPKPPSHVGTRICVTAVLEPWQQQDSVLQWRSHLDQQHPLTQHPLPGVSDPHSLLRPPLNTA